MRKRRDTENASRAAENADVRKRDTDKFGIK